jgi:hypothetical protein
LESGAYFGCFASTGAILLVKADKNAATTDIKCANGYFKSAADACSPCDLTVYSSGTTVIGGAAD